MDELAGDLLIEVERTPLPTTAEGYSADAECCRGVIGESRAGENEPMNTLPWTTGAFM